MVVYVPLVNVNNFIFDRFGSFEYKHSATIVLNTDDSGIVWGTLNVNALHSADGAISMTTTDIPLWCNAENTAGLEQ